MCGAGHFFSAKCVGYLKNVQYYYYMAQNIQTDEVMVNIASLIAITAAKGYI